MTNEPSYRLKLFLNYLPFIENWCYLHLVAYSLRSMLLQMLVSLGRRSRWYLHHTLLHFPSNSYIYFFIFLKIDIISWLMNYNSGPQSVVLDIVASLFSFHVYTFRIILAVPSKQDFCDCSTVSCKPVFSIHFLKSFVTVPINVQLT